MFPLIGNDRKHTSHHKSVFVKPKLVPLLEVVLRLAERDLTNVSVNWIKSVQKHLLFDAVRVGVEEYHEEPRHKYFKSYGCIILWSLRVHSKKGPRSQVIYYHLCPSCLDYIRYLVVPGASKT